MRIRKNAKISTLLCTSHYQEPNICQLNQSPWDIITFPPSHSSSPSFHQFDGFDAHYNVNLAGNWSSVDSTGAIESVASTKSSFECEYDDGNVKESDLGFVEGDDEIVLCGKANGKGWQCGGVAKNGNIMCDLHLVDPTKKKARPSPGGAGGSRPHRTRKRVAAATTNPHEFYYYSGFGPTWGKKRGAAGRGQCNESTTFNAHGTLSNNSNIYETSGGDGVEETATMLPEGLDYVDEEEDEEIEKVGKTRGRKPIKARSLKSLM